MSRYIIFSRWFPRYHPRTGEPTHFVEKIIKGLPGYPPDRKLPPALFSGEYGYNCNIRNDRKIRPKFHTFREGNRWKPGDMFSPRVWSGLPYRSTQIIIGPDIEVKKTWDVKLFRAGGGPPYLGYPSKNMKDYTSLISLGDAAVNDGFEDYRDFVDWFKPLPFVGQIICWNEKIKY